MPASAHPWLIIGGGLAGSLLSWRLVQAGERVWLADGGAKWAASGVAAGMANVVTGGRMRLSWQADLLLAELKALMAELPPAVRQHWHPGPILRPFQSAAELNEWTAQADHPAFRPVVEIQPSLPPRVRGHLGALVVQQTGWLAVGPFLADLHAILGLDSCFQRLPEWVDYAAIDPVKPAWQGTPLAGILFCEGAGANANPWWPVAPIRPLTGELLHVHIPGLELREILSRGGYLVPAGGADYILGATYDKHPADADPSEDAQRQLLEQLHKLLDLNGLEVSVRSHQAGLRPTTRDRRPVLGSHPHYPKLSFFNGLGTKGVLQAPWLSRRLAAHLLHGEPLPAAVRMDRLAGKA